MQELLIAAQSVFHPIGWMMLQVLTLTICVELNARGEVGGDSKRDLSLLNQLLELLGAISEGLTKFRIDWIGNTRVSRQEPASALLLDHIVQQFSAKWTTERPGWQELLQNSKEGNWRESPSRRSKSSEPKKQEVPFIKALDALWEMNRDINEIVFEAQSVLPLDHSVLSRASLQEHLLDGCVGMTLAVVDVLAQGSYPEIAR